MGKDYFSYFGKIKQNDVISDLITVSDKRDDFQNVDYNSLVLVHLVVNKIALEILNNHMDILKIGEVEVKNIKKRKKEKDSENLIDILKIKKVEDIFYKTEHLLVHTVNVRILKIIKVKDKDMFIKN